MMVVGPCCSVVEPGDLRYRSSRFVRTGFVDVVVFGCDRPRVRFMSLSESLVLSYAPGVAGSCFQQGLIFSEAPSERVRPSAHGLEPRSLCACSNRPPPQGIRGPICTGVPVLSLIHI